MTAWIQRLNRAELTQLLESQFISSEGTIDDLRRRLREYIRENPNVINPPTTEITGITMPHDQSGPTIKPGPAIEHHTVPTNAVPRLLNGS